MERSQHLNNVNIYLFQHSFQRHQIYIHPRRHTNFKNSLDTLTGNSHTLIPMPFCTILKGKKNNHICIFSRSVGGETVMVKLITPGIIKEKKKKKGGYSLTPPF